MYGFNELVDLVAIKGLMQAFLNLTGIPSAILDRSGRVLTNEDGQLFGVGWKRICRDFHRADPRTAARCVESDLALAAGLRPKQPTFHRCPNGLIDAALPIIVDGQHVASLFTGQFFLAPPDEAWFRRQAARSGFEESAYLGALREVPVFTEAFARDALVFLEELANTIAEMGMRQKKLLDANRLIEEVVQARTNALAAANEALFVDDLIIDLVPIPLFLKNKEGRYIQCNAACRKFLSLSREQIIGKTSYEIFRREEADVFCTQDRALFEQGGQQVYETKVTSSEGLERIVQFHKQAFSDSSGAVAGFIAAIFDITEKKSLERTLASLAATDELTGLSNRREGMARFEALHKDCERKHRPYCVAMVDIDNFKQFNDQYGHALGDSALRAFAAMARATLRGSDLCFRYGGEEFVLLLPETPLNEGYKIAERLRHAWELIRLPLPDGQWTRATASIGLGQYPTAGASIDRLLQASDRALYDAKNSGRNRTVCV